MCVSCVSESPRGVCVCVRVSVICVWLSVEEHACVRQSVRLRAGGVCMRATRHTVDELLVARVGVQPHHRALRALQRHLPMRHGCLRVVRGKGLWRRGQRFRSLPVRCRVAAGWLGDAVHAAGRCWHPACRRAIPPAAALRLAVARVAVHARSTHAARTRRRRGAPPARHLTTGSCMGNFAQIFIEQRRWCRG